VNSIKFLENGVAYELDVVFSPSTLRMMGELAVLIAPVVGQMPSKEGAQLQHLRGLLAGRRRQERG